jgi:hypothetical protein
VPEDAAEAKNTPEAADAEANPNTLRTAVRVGIGALGLGAFVVGVVISWKSQASTVLLVVGAVILLLAVLGLDWEEIRGSYGGMSFRLLRRQLEDVSQGVGEARTIVAAAASQDEPSAEVLQAAVERLDRVEEEVQALSRPVVRPRPGSALARAAAGGGAGQSDPALDALMFELRRTQTKHSFDDGRVILTLRTLPKTSGFRCTVKTPRQTSYEAITRRAIVAAVAVVGAAVEYRTTYPDDFPGSEALTAGTYEVEWREVTPTNADGLAAVLVGAQPPPIATDAFTVVAGEANAN